MSKLLRIKRHKESKSVFGILIAPLDWSTGYYKNIKKFWRIHLHTVCVRVCVWLDRNRKISPLPIPSILPFFNSKCVFLTENRFVLHLGHCADGDYNFRRYIQNGGRLHTGRWTNESQYYSKLYTFVGNSKAT